MQPQGVQGGEVVGGVLKRGPEVGHGLGQAALALALHRPQLEEQGMAEPAGQSRLGQLDGAVDVPRPGRLGRLEKELAIVLGGDRPVANPAHLKLGRGARTSAAPSA